MSIFDTLLVAHLLADWLLQNDWMARNKTDLWHPAAWTHGGIHFLAVLPICVAAGMWWMAAILALAHMLVDTRSALAWWRRFFRQTTEGPVALDVALWGDQVTHILWLAAAALWMSR